MLFLPWFGPLFSCPKNNLVLNPVSSIERVSVLSPFKAYSTKLSISCPTFRSVISSQIWLILCLTFSLFMLLLTSHILPLMSIPLSTAVNMACCFQWHIQWEYPTHKWTSIHFISWFCYIWRNVERQQGCSVVDAGVLGLLLLHVYGLHAMFP